MTSAIGGFFELSLNDFGSVYHDSAYALNTGRNALEFILRERNVKKVLLPYYTCDALLIPLQRLGISYRFYYLDENLSPIIKNYKEDECVIINNYFGIQDADIEKWLEKNDFHVIIDNSQAFYHKILNKSVGVFYSSRKFFGVPDGGFAYTEKQNDYYDNLMIDKSFKRCSHLVRRIDLSPEEAYNEYLKNESLLNRVEVKKMSELSSFLLKNIHFDEIKSKRKSNFEFLHKTFEKENRLTKIINQNRNSTPMIYPLLIENGIHLRDYLINNRIYVAQYWPNVLEWLGKEQTLEEKLVKNLVALPIDQRISESDLDRMTYIILNYFNE